MKPKYLYHYTNIETLALILKTKKIRFNRLDNVDDLEEAKTYDLGNLGRYCFVSCWTANEEESIPFWAMYTRDMRGVRLRMPSDMFKTYEVSSDDKQICFDTVRNSKFKKDEIFRKNTFISYPWDEILNKVEYTDDEELIYPKILNVNTNSDLDNTLKLGMLGKYKRSNWSFQEEWRYKFNILPIDLDEVKLGDNSRFITHINEKLNLDINCYFLEINENKIKELEITMGPNTTEAEKIIVEALIKQFNPTTKLYNSNLINKVRPK